MSATRFILPIVATMLAAMLPQCTNRATVSGGGGIETVALAGHAKRADNSVPVNAAVYMRRSSFVTDTGTASVAPDAYVDSQGNFLVDSVAPGSYVIEVNDRLQNAGIIMCDVAAGGRDKDIGVDTLRQYAAVSGSVAAGVNTQAWVLVHGLQRAVKTDATGAFVLADLPSGNFTLRFEPASATVGSRDTSNIAALAGATTIVAPVAMFTFVSEDYTGWKYSCRIVLNTTATGADVAASVPGFPLLVRLTSANVDFSQFAADGADIRFADAAGSHLRYEIARFDKAAGAADVWVLVDTVQGNASTQTITMVWGRPDLTNWSSGAAVFSPSLGYAAVWHLDSLTDATGNGNSLVNRGAAIAAGISANGYSFNGTSSFLSCGPSASLNMAAGNLTIVVWEKSADHWSTERMLFEHDVWPNSGTYSLSTRNDSIISFDFPSARAEVRGWQGSNSDDAWHCLVATLNDHLDTGRIYRDGVLVHSDTVRSSIGSSLASAYIGCRGGTERFFRGDIDEVWIINREMLAEWLKLLYENIRENQTLCTIAP